MLQVQAQAVRVSEGAQDDAEVQARIGQLVGSCTLSWKDTRADNSSKQVACFAELALSRCSEPM